MIKFKLKRVGKKGQAFYRVVVIESTKKRSSNYIEDLGWYNPHLEAGKSFNIDIEKAREWIKNGAQPTETIAQFFVKLGLIDKLHRGSRLAKAPVAPATEKPAEKATETEVPDQADQSNESTKTEAEATEATAETPNAEEQTEDQANTQPTDQTSEEPK
ncbi:MAG TPA: 30S ribosomal protein S16 [Candidatus Dojkabacteria bacterium]|nr:30S ribosomal protein S16 [Candidatus Dojkabacteria bacterium]